MQVSLDTWTQKSEDENTHFFAGIEWSLDGDASNATVLVASEAHTITLAVEGLLGVVFTVATLTDEAVDLGEVSSFSFFRFDILYNHVFYYNAILKWVHLFLCSFDITA